MRQRKMVYSAVLFVFIFLAGCAGILGENQPSAVGIDGVACRGQIEAPPEGLVAADDQDLLLSALGESGHGKLCEGKVFVAVKPVTVYRVWSSKKVNAAYGVWWSFDEPKGPKSKYRADNVVCPTWSSLDRISSCVLKTGAKIVVGTGQSAKCEQISYPKSPVNQVFIPNDIDKNIMYVEKCTPGADWPNR